ncbi:MAG: TonB-dependent receptor plug domain-containing protein [Rikenellaceae bacterium]|nr:TonB-dependent receptor plug domain-containing protein [Rikenellaceae bacterium]
MKKNTTIPDSGRRNAFCRRGFLFIGLLAGMLLTPAAAALSQRQTVSLELREGTVIQLFREIQQQTRLDFVYNVRDFDRFGRLDVSARNEPVVHLLDRLFGFAVTFEFQDNAVIARPRPAGQPYHSGAITITGTVQDPGGQPLPGVAVTIRDNNRVGTVTDPRGVFSLTIPSTSVDLYVQFQFLGMMPAVRKFNGQPIHLVMRETVEEMENVIVTGYNHWNPEDITGSAVRVDPKEWLPQDATNIADMLQGAVAGVSVVNTSGQVGSSPKIRIRGTSTLLGNQEPLWVVDGVIQRDPLPLPSNSGSLGGDLTEMREIAASAISWLNPLDIETMTILKDASATAIYGSQAANGVIVLTTKKGRPGKVSVSYSDNYSVGQKPRYSHYDLMNSQELMEFSKEVYEARDAYTSPVLPIGHRVRRFDPAAAQ